MRRDTTLDEATPLRLNNKNLPLLFSFPPGWEQCCVVCTACEVFVVFVSQTDLLLVFRDDTLYYLPRYQVHTELQLLFSIFKESKQSYWFGKHQQPLLTMIFPLRPRPAPFQINTQFQHDSAVPSDINAYLSLFSLLAFIIVSILSLPRWLFSLYQGLRCPGSWSELLSSLYTHIHSYSIGVWSILEISRQWQGKVTGSVGLTFWKMSVSSSLAMTARGLSLVVICHDSCYHDISKNITGGYQMCLCIWGLPSFIYQ